MKKSALGVLLILFTVISPLSAQLIVAHRGASYDAPENTMAAFRLAWEQGADAVEGDFHLTSDGKIVCIHDGTTERTTGKDLKISDSALADLRKLEYGAWKDPRFEGEPIPTLAEVLERIPDGKRLFLEVKTGPAIVPALVAAFSKSKIKGEQIVIIAFNEQVIAAVKKALPEIKACWLVSFKQDKNSGEWTPSVASILKTLQRIGADGLDCRAELAVVNETFVEEIRAVGLELHCWTVNDPEQAHTLHRLGIDSLTTDRPAFIRKAVESQP